MMSTKILTLSTGMTLAAGMLVSASASVPSQPLTFSRPFGVSQASAFTGNQLTGVQVAREKQPMDDRGRDRKDRDGAKHKLIAAGGNKPCQLYYGCVPTPAPVPKTGGKGGNNDPKPHKFAPDAIGIQIARENQPMDDRGRDRKDRDHERHGANHKFVDYIA